MGKFMDLTGQRFGKLVVIHCAGNNKYGNILWFCECDCGSTTIVRASLLRSGQTKRCCKETCSGLYLKNLSGKKFGTLLVLDRAKNYKNGTTRWNCICDCGNKTIVGGYSLHKGITKSCNKTGCKRSLIKDLIGQRFGNLLVISQAHRYKNNQVQWNCVCDCGKNCTVLARCLDGGNTKSCGCLKKFPDKTLASKRSLFRKYKRSAEVRGHPFRIFFENFLDTIKQNCHYCGSPPNHYFYCYKKSGGFYCNGIDRLDSKIGYELGNIVPCCKSCNYLKWSRNENEFILWIKKCYAHKELRFRPSIVLPIINLKIIGKRYEDRSMHSKITLYGIYKKMALLRMYPFNLKFEDFISLTQENCYFCGTPPSNHIQKGSSKFLYNGIDRLNNELGYDIDNSVPCCKKCNESKSNLSVDNFDKKIDNCYKHIVIGQGPGTRT